MISLRPMTEEEFQGYLARSIPEYASENVRSGNWPPNGAQQRAEKEYAKLLPTGLSTPNQYIYTVLLDETSVGEVWLSIEHNAEARVGFIYDLHIAEEYRRRGIASEAMRFLEREALALGLTKLSLHVFGHNHGARDLYEKLGYVITNLIMSKPLSDA